MEVSHWKRIKCFPSELHWRNLKMQQLPAILNLCLKRSRSGRSSDYRDYVVDERKLKLCIQNVFRPLKNVKPAFSNSSSLYNGQENHCFRDGFVWTLGLTVKFLSVRFLEINHFRSIVFFRFLLVFFLVLEKQIF